MKKIILYFLSSVASFAVSGQNTIALPQILNYGVRDFHAGTQTWKIKQDKNGIIYAANNEGLLSFDGKNWNLYPLPNKTIARSIEIGFDNKIYVGGQDELGYFLPSLNGRLEYHSLTELLPVKDKIFEDVWDIISFNKSIFIRTNTKIFKLTNNKIETYLATTGWSYMGLSNGKLYAHDYKTGILYFENNEWVALSPNNLFSINGSVSAIIGIENGSSIICTQRNSMYLINDTNIKKIQAADNSVFENEKITTAIAINKDEIAIATSSNGLLIVNHQAKILQRFTKKEGLQNNDILSLFLDTQKNIWLGLENGIDLIAYDNAIKLINPTNEDGAGYAAIMYENKLFLGTTDGLYSATLPKINDLSFAKTTFTEVINSKGQVWGLATINNQLLLGKNEGAFVVSNNVANILSTSLGYWKFLPLSNTFPSSQMIAGNYKNLEIFDFVGGKFSLSKKIEGFEESARFIAIDKNENIWVSHPYHGIYKVTKKSDGSYQTILYGNKQGLPSSLNNHIYKIKNEILVGTIKGIYTYNDKENIFEPSLYYKNLLGNQSIRYLKEDPEGNIWYVHEKSVGIIDFTDKDPIIVSIAELNDKILSGFEFIYPLNKNNIFIGGGKGFYLLNFEKYKLANSKLEVQIRKVKTSGEADSILFGGYFNNVNEAQIQNKNKLPEIAVGWKSIQFQFASSIFGNINYLQYCYRLKGFDEAWSEWADRTEKEYTNLPAGTFQFEVKVRNNLGKESSINSYTFKVLPHWYKTIWAYILYFLLFLMAIFFYGKWQLNKFEKQQFKFEEEQEKLKYIHQLELQKNEKEILELQNEKLLSEVIYKNKELADVSMHLVERSDALVKIKDELQQLYKKTGGNHDVKKAIQLVSDIEKNNLNWEQFAIHFDEINNGFLNKLKSAYPNLTNTDLKVCAYLQLKLSTKEIAQLMNISVRGVEISRYRLRKKLQLSTDQSLNNFLLEIVNKKRI